jgi:hypothetical protein
MSKLILLSPSSKEYDMICDLVSKSHPNECIISIHQIINSTFIEQFEQCRKMLKEKRNKDPSEIWAFHGCSPSSAGNIIQNGFDISYNTTSAYGIGNYFSAFYGVSKSYSTMKKNPKLQYQTMIVVKLLLGVKGQKNNSNEIDTKEVDYTGTTDNSIIALPYNEASLPMYVVQFYK